MSDPHRVSRAPEPVSALWLAALLPALVLGGLTSGGAFLVGRDEGLSALVGVGLAVTALCLTTVLHWQIRMTDPFMGMALALTTYGLVIALMWAAYLSLGESDWLVGPATAFGLLAGTLGWAGGHMRGALKLRQPVYDDRDTPR
ncbi:hypothetical protein KIH74_24215 [Kineosporia sp. J2-2]|uniref:Uncharacterized protein n=1 Tax=Kineosporia corallincola TaxID=2835133 RepID=A0ABS5TLU2_9ACTN|nr:hypothetical protein [Kineosporia corallincola]MBT0772070.1 hypothetical protein [Kineosporia corallincola]